MKYSISEVVEFIAENDVKFVRLVFCDVFGRIKNVTVMADCIEEVCRNGKAFTPTGIDGFGNGRPAFVSRSGYAQRTAVASAAGARDPLYLFGEKAGRFFLLR